MMFLKKLLWGVGKLTIATVLLMAILGGWAAYAERHAENQAQAFCDTVAIGQKTDQLFTQALAAKADAHQTRWFQAANGRDNDWLPVTFLGVTPFNRHYCSIEARDGVVLTKAVKYMD